MSRSAAAGAIAASSCPCAEPRRVDTCSSWPSANAICSASTFDPQAFAAAIAADSSVSSISGAGRGAYASRRIWASRRAAPTASHKASALSMSADAMPASRPISTADCTSSRSTTPRGSDMACARSSDAAARCAVTAAHRFSASAIRCGATRASMARSICSRRKLRWSDEIGVLITSCSEAPASLLSLSLRYAAAARPAWGTRSRTAHRRRSEKVSEGHGRRAA